MGRRRGSFAANYLYLFIVHMYIIINYECKSFFHSSVLNNKLFQYFYTSSCIFMWEIHNFCCVPFRVVDGVDPAAALWLEAENQKSGVY